MLSRVLHARVGVLRPHLRTNPALPRMMDDRHLRKVAHPPTGALDAQAEVRLLAVDEEALVEEARGLECLAPCEHERPRRPVAVDYPVISLETQLSSRSSVARKGRRSEPRA